MKSWPLPAAAAIYRYTAPDGQEIYLVADERQEPVLHREDVNFDGVEDVVALTRLGASNAFYDFFVWDGRQYVYATSPGQEAGLANYGLDADRGYVWTQANNCMAGLECEYGVYRWQGTELAPVRVLRAETSSRWQDSPDGSYSFAIVYDNRILRATVTDYPDGVYEGRVIWEKEFELEAEDFDGAEVWEEMRGALTAGLSKTEKSQCLSGLPAGKTVRRGEKKGVPIFVRNAYSVFQEDFFMNNLNTTVSADRPHIGFFGLRNAGKSSVVNAVTGQNLSLVSDVKGTTTDPVHKAMELLPHGAGGHHRHSRAWTTRANWAKCGCIGPGRCWPRPTSPCWWWTRCAGLQPQRRSRC